MVMYLLLGIRFYIIGANLGSLCGFCNQQFTVSGQNLCHSAFKIGRRLPDNDVCTISGVCSKKMRFFHSASRSTDSNDIIGFNIKTVLFKHG
jgi:hypothetical protein